MRVLHALAAVLQRFGFLFLLPVPFAFWYDPANTPLVAGIAVPHTVLAFLAAFAVTLILWLPVRLATAEAGEEDLHDMEAYLALALTAVVLPVVAMLPFLFSGAVPRPVDAYFESVSGLTTTASTVLYLQPHRIPGSIILYRGVLSAAGGLAIIVLAVAFLSRLTQSGLHALQAQTPHTATTRIQRRITYLTKTLGSIYGFLIAALFLILVLLLRMDGMSWKAGILDALVLAMTTLSTGGFVPRPGGIGAYDYWLLEGILVPFMIVGATSFTLHYHFFQGRPMRLFRDVEWRFFLAIIVVAAGIISLLRWRDGIAPIESIEDSLFTATSLLTTSGFQVGHIQTWPSATHLLLVLLLFIGGTTGSTSGGLKPLRVLLLLKVLWRELQKLLHPRAVIPIRVAGRVLPEQPLLTVIAFFFSLLTLWMFGAGLLIWLEPDLGLLDGAATAIGAVSNTGTTLRPLGPLSFASLGDGSKLILSALMLLGRLEILPFLLLIRPSVWRS